MLIVVHSLGTFAYASITNYKSKALHLLDMSPDSISTSECMGNNGKISIFNRQRLQAAQFFLRSIHLVTTIAMSYL